MSEDKAWLATEDPTEGDLPATEFVGSRKDVEQTLDPQEGDGSDILPEPEPRQEAGE